MKKSGKQQKNLWLVSFGDLLTLMLCFFLSLVAYGHVKPASSGPDVASTNCNDRQSDPNCVASNPEKVDGTSLANYQISSTSAGETLIFNFNENDFEAETGQLKLMAYDRVKTVVETKEYVPKTVFVEVCSTVGSDGGWFDSLKRAVAIKSQLFDTDRFKLHLNIRSVGPYCESIEQAETTQQVFARLVFKGKQVIKGEQV